MDAGELRRRLGISPQTMMRMVRDAGPAIVRIGRARATRYGLRQAWPNLQTANFPVFRVDRNGAATAAGELITLAARQAFWATAGVVSDGLPVELADARPAGFLGRHFAATHGDLRLPLRLEDWSDHHILLAMTRRGEDLPGNLIVGAESFARWQVLENRVGTQGDYPAIAEATIAGHPPLSSAGGERPKFGVMVNGRHVLVKFAARGGPDDRAARRWCDLLVLEALALNIVSSYGISAATTHLVEASSHVFLESERFDRAGARGRVAVQSLAAVHNDLADSWAQAAVQLGITGRLAEDDARRLRWLDAFGALIANTDRHHYNVVFFSEGPRLRLAPAFDQVSMFYAPAADGQVPVRVFARPHPTAETLDVWEEARAAAQEFWQRASDDARLSDDMRAIAADNVRA